jgi:hypothetical protein
MEQFVDRLLALRDSQGEIDSDDIIVYTGEDGTIHAFLKEQDFQGSLAFHPIKFYERVVIRKIGKTNHGYLLQKQRRALRSMGFTVDPDSAYRSSGFPD